MTSQHPPVPTSTVPSVLLPELLGFVPQFLLDDIVDTANDAVKQAVDAMEQFLERWASSRRASNADWDSTQEIEQGLVAFQTLLNTHVDIAFDFFETWSLRNIFAVPADLPVVAPHQEGLEMDRTEEEELGLEAEIRELRKRIHAQRKLERLFTISTRLSSIQRAASERRLSQLSFLRSPQLQTLLSLPDSFLAMYDAVTSLPPSTGEDTEELNVPLPEPGKRMWETNRMGYVNWAVEQLLARAREQGVGGAGGQANSKDSNERVEGGAVASVAASAAIIGSTEDVRASAVFAGSSPSGSGSRQGQERDMDIS